MLGAVDVGSRQECRECLPAWHRFSRCGADFRSRPGWAPHHIGLEVGASWATIRLEPPRRLSPKPTGGGYARWRMRKYPLRSAMILTQDPTDEAFW